ncbi:MAG: Anti-repressor SinI [Paenibacillus sp.]|jgi:DNA-binding transcriptional MerR regulator|nr:Anti-repressor SinI [Paenibacillus sp.]
MNARKTAPYVPELDAEWIDLIATAQSIGIPLEEVRHFIQVTGNSEAQDREDIRVVHFRKLRYR